MMFKNLFNRKDGEEGFSLIELIVVVAILGILVAIAIPVYGNIQTTARHNAMRALAQNAYTSIFSFVTDGGSIMESNCVGGSHSGCGDVMGTDADGDTVVVFSQENGPQTNSGGGAIWAGIHDQMGPNASDPAIRVYVYDNHSGWLARSTWGGVEEYWS